MVINGDKLRRLAAEAGVSREDLAQSLVGVKGMTERDAMSAVGNWMGGRNHPRVKPAHIERLAQRLGIGHMAFTRFVSSANFQRGSARKARLVADMIRGMPVDRALTVLEFNPKRASVVVRKTLATAIADAEQADADVSELIVAESRVDGGAIIKRFQPKDRGRAHPIRKRTSHIVVGVEERN